MNRIARSFARFFALLRRSAPYVLLELLLPGGTLFALLFAIYQHRHELATPKPAPLHVVAAHAVVTVRPKLTLVVRSDAVTGVGLAAYNDAAPTPLRRSV